MFMASEDVDHILPKLVHRLGCEPGSHGDGIRRRAKGLTWVGAIVIALGSQGLLHILTQGPIQADGRIMAIDQEVGNIPDARDLGRVATEEYLGNVRSFALVLLLRLARDEVFD